jgi:hypothetical protein
MVEREERGLREISGAGLGKVFWSDKGRRTVGAGISGNEGNSSPGSIDLKEIGACETT